MIESIVTAVMSLPTWLAIMLLAAMPVTEIQLAIPVGLQSDLPTLGVIALSLLGNIAIAIPIFFGFTRLRGVIERMHAGSVVWFDRLLERGKKKMGPDYARYGAFGLYVFLAIPLPLTGVWTATLAAVALKIPFRQTMAGIVLGQMTAALIIYLATVGVTGIVNHV